MPYRDPINLVSAIVGAEIKTEGIAAEEVLPRGAVVTVSRDYGSGGLEIARLLADKLGVRAFDREILDAVAKDANVDKYLMDRLDEKVRSSLDDWAFTTITGQSSFKEDYRRHLVNVILGIAKSGGVIVGRGAHYILHRETAFRIRITGSLSKCADRVAKRKNISIEEAEKEVRRVNNERAEFLRNLYGADPCDFSVYDLVLNSDRFTREAAVALIIQAMRSAGFPA